MFDLVTYVIYSNELDTGALQYHQDWQYVTNLKHPIKKAVCRYLRLLCHGLCLLQVMCCLPTLLVVIDLGIYSRFTPASRGCREFWKRTRRVTVLLSLTAPQMNALVARTVQAWTTLLISFLEIIKDGLMDSPRLPLRHHHLPRLLLLSQGIRGQGTRVVLLKKLAETRDIACPWEDRGKGNDDFFIQRPN